MSEIIIAIIITWLALWAEHWFPWQLVLRRKLPRLVAYVLGVLAMAGPLTWLYWLWLLTAAPWPGVHLVALWAVIVVGGLSTMGAWGIDTAARWLVSQQEHIERMEQRNGRQD